MDFISKLLQRKPSKSGSGSNGQSSDAGVTVDCLTSSCKENVHTRSTEKIPCDPSPKLSENISDSVSSEDLETVKQAQDSSFKSGDSNLSLPDLLLPEAVYKKQPDTDTDTADYESAADTYGSATDISEAVTPSEKYGPQVFDEVVILHKRKSSIFLDDSEDETSAEKTGETITCEGANCRVKECACNAGKSDLTHPQDSPIVSKDRKLAQLVSKDPKSIDLSLCEAFSQLCLESPLRRSSAKGEIDLDGRSSTDEAESKEDINVLLDKTYQALPSILDETYNLISSAQTEDDTLLKPELDNNHDLSLLNFGQKGSSIHTTDIGDTEHTLAQKSSVGETDLKPELDNNSDLPLLNFEQKVGGIRTTDIGDTEHILAEKFLPGERDLKPEFDNSDLSLLNFGQKERSIHTTDIGDTEHTLAQKSSVGETDLKPELDNNSDLPLLNFEQKVGGIRTTDIGDTEHILTEKFLPGERDLKPEFNNSDLSLLNFGQKERSIHTTDIGDTEHTLVQKILPEETDLNNVPEKLSHICLLNERDERAEPVTSQSFEVEDVSVPSLLIDEKEVPKEEKTEVVNINFLDEKTLCKSAGAEDKTEISNIPSKELPQSYISPHDVEHILSGSLTDPVLPTPVVQRCVEIQEGNLLDPVHKDSDSARYLNITEHTTEGIVENLDDKHLSEKNKVCDLDISEVTVQEICKSERNRAELYTTDVNTCRSLQSDTQSSGNGKLEKEQLPSQDPVSLVEALKTDRSQSNDEQLPSDTCQTQENLTGDDSLYESPILGDECLEIRRKKIVLDIKEEEVVDASKLNQLIEICNRQQEDLNQTVAEFVQETLISPLFRNVQDSRDEITTVSTVPAECESAILSLPLIQEETCCNITQNDNLKFEDIAFEASKVAESILHSSEDTDLDSESDTLSTIPLKMADSEEFSTSCTGSPMQSKMSVHHLSSSCDVHSEDCNDAPKGNSLALSSSDLAADKEKDIKQKSAHPEVNQSEAGPEIADDVSCKAEDVYWLLLMNKSKLADVFKDASAFDFLSAIGSTQAAHDLRKQSLYVKFDPLVESMSQTEKVKVSSPSGEPCRERISSVAASGGSKALELVEKLISVTPTPKKRDQEVMNRRSASSIPKELFPVKKEEVVEVSKPEQQSVESRESGNEEVLHLREELERLKQQMMEEAAVHEQEKEELKNKLRDSEVAKRNAEESERRKDRLLNEKSQTLSQMSIILEEYEKTISRLVAEKEHDKQAQSIEVARLTKEKDTMSTHLENIEIAFSDVHQKYEKSKQVIQGFVKNEEALRASLAEYESTIKKQEQKYDVLKNHAMAQLEGANEELNMLHRNHQVELTKLRAMLKKAELKVSSLEEVVEQKTKENQELVTICDELIGNVETK